ncbi:MAG: DUF1836 domain-containing protein [Lachnospiraceae bacterium]
MSKTNEERLKDLFARLDSLSYIKPDSIPDIPLYMDQVTTFMDEHLGHTKRYPEDKVLTKTMINNYAKNNLLPPPIKKKYSKEHMLMLIFIYYFKNLLSFHDIEELFRPISGEHFNSQSGLSLETIYNEVFALEDSQMENLKADVAEKFRQASRTFPEAEEADREYLQLFSFICELSFDVYLKNQMIEMLIDGLRAEHDSSGKKKK